VAKRWGNPRFFACVVPPGCGLENLPGKKCRAQRSPSFTAYFLPSKQPANGCALPINSSCPLPAVLLIGKRLSWAGRRELNGWKTSAPSPGMGGRKIFRRLTSPLAATLPIKSSQEAAVGSELARAQGNARPRAAYNRHLAVLSAQRGFGVNCVATATCNAAATGRFSRKSAHNRCTQPKTFFG